MTIDFRSTCPIARAMDILGDRWTLVVLRTLFMGARRYADLLRAPEGISTNILADRLALLEREGLVERRLYQERPERYEYRLTHKGADLLPVLQTLATWAGKHIEGCRTPPPALYTSQPDDFLPEKPA